MRSSSQCSLPCRGWGGSGMGDAGLWTFQPTSGKHLCFMYQRDLVYNLFLLLLLFFFFFRFSFFLFWLHPWHMEVPGPGTKSEQQLRPMLQLPHCGWHGNTVGTSIIHILKKKKDRVGGEKIWYHMASRDWYGFPLSW